MKPACLSSPERYTLRDLYKSEGFEHVTPMQQHLDQARSTSQQATIATLTQLLTGSNADEFSSITHYIEAGEKPINADLRRGGCKPLNASTAELMHDLKSLANFDGVGYRAAYVTPQGLAALKQIGTHVFDAGLMSAATGIQSVKGWLDWGKDHMPSVERHPVMLIMDASIPKKNLASSFLPDHVGIPPMVEMVVRDVRQEDQATAILLSRAKPHADGAVSLTDGKPHGRGELDVRNERIYKHREGYGA